jgi:MFS family permease
MSDRPPHPSVFMFLITPFGVMSGYLTVTVAWILTRNHLSVEQVAGLIAISFIPHTWKFVWAPVADTTLRRKTWYLIGAGVSALGIVATGALPMTKAGLPLLTAVVLASNVAVTLLGMSTESLMAYDVPEAEKGRAGGWFQAGNLGGNGLGGGAGLWMAQRLPGAWMPGAVLAGFCLLCALGLLFVSEPPLANERRGVLANLRFVALDLWAVARSRMGFLALFLCFLPIGSGAASGLWSAVAGDWKASANTVALVTGVLAGFVSAGGCIAGGWVCDRMDRKAAYVAFGVLQAMCAVAMALAPRTEQSFVIFTTIYSFITGLTYAGFTAFVLEAMGTGAAATKFSLFASLSNFPIMYMTTIDGHAHTRWGPVGMLHTEAAVGMAGLVLFLGVLAAVQRVRPPAAGLPASG